MLPWEIAESVYMCPIFNINVELLSGPKKRVIYSRGSNAFKPLEIERWRLQIRNRRENPL